MSDMGLEIFLGVGQECYCMGNKLEFSIYPISYTEPVSMVHLPRSLISCDSQALCRVRTSSEGSAS